MMEMFNPTEKLELLAASASEIHAAATTDHGKLRVEFKSDEDRTRKRQMRLLKNRQSAALSRQRKKEYITDLEERTNGLITENQELVQKIAKLSSMNLEFKMHIDSLEKSLNETKNENIELRSHIASVSGGASILSSLPSSTTNNNISSTTFITPASSPTSSSSSPALSSPSPSLSSSSSASPSLSPINLEDKDNRSPTSVQNPILSP